MSTGFHIGRADATFAPRLRIRGEVTSASASFPVFRFLAVAPFVRDLVGVETGCFDEISFDVLVERGFDGGRIEGVGAAFISFLEY